MIKPKMEAPKGIRTLREYNTNEGTLPLANRTGIIRKISTYS